MAAAYVLQSIQLSVASDIVHQTKSVKIIKDRDEKPKGFGYVEFADLDALKDALAKTGSVSKLHDIFRPSLTKSRTIQPLAGRGVRVSVAEPRKCAKSDPDPASHH